MVVFGYYSSSDPSEDDELAARSRIQGTEPPSHGILFMQSILCHAVYLKPLEGP